MAIGVKDTTNLWVPVDRTDFWGFKAEGEELVRYREFKVALQIEADRSMGRMIEKIANFFVVPSVHVEHSIPRVCVTDVVAGGSAGHNPGSNSIDLPCKYALPYLLGDAKDLRQTHFYPTLAHEVGHYVTLAGLTHGDPAKFFDAYLYRLGRLEDEFSARISQRLICEDMMIDLRVVGESEFGRKDPHRAYVFADKHFLAIKQLNSLERRELALHPEKFLEYMK